MRPASLDELCQALRESGEKRIAGSGSKLGRLGLGSMEPNLWLDRLSGVVEIAPADRYVVAWAGTTIAELQRELTPHGQAIALPSPDEHGPYLAGWPGTLGGLLAMGLPHGREATLGPVRDHVLGVTVVRADGSVAKAGGRTVKNVAGYDVGRFLVGSRGELAVFAQVVLRTFPRKALPGVSGEHRRTASGPVWIHRVPRSRFGADPAALAHDPETGTSWLDERPRTMAGDWLIPGPLPLPELVRRAKSIFDPEGKLNPHLSWETAPPLGAREGSR